MMSTLKRNWLQSLMPCSPFTSNISLGLQKILLLFLFMHTFLEETGRCKWGNDPGPAINVAQRMRFGFLSTVLYLKGDDLTSGEANQRRSIMSLLLYPTTRQAQSNKQKVLQNWGSCNAFTQLSSLLHLNWNYFVSVYPPSNISPKMGLCMFIQNQTPNFMLHLVNIPSYVFQRRISFDANTLLAV